MGGALLITVELPTKKEAQKQLDRLMSEAKLMGLCEDHKAVVRYDRKAKLWRGYAGVHT